MAEARLAAERVLVCCSQGEQFALPMAQVREVVALPPLSRLPGTSDQVLGLANVHGILITVLRAPVLASSLEPRPPEMLVVLTIHRGQVGFAVEAVEDLSGPNPPGVRQVEVETVVRGVLGGP